ncbi:MAG: sulfotransferase [Chloroflexota bacterium]
MTANPPDPIQAPARAGYPLVGRYLWKLPAWSGPATTLPPLFVGGTGRSGTTITAKILGAHPDYWMVPFEVRFLSDNGGLCDVVDGKASVGKFERLVTGRWFDRGPKQGLHLLADKPTLAAAVRELGAGMDKEPLAAAARFVDRVLGPGTQAMGAKGWIEMTPGLVQVAPALARIFPEGRMVHSVRDGRDVACSVVPLKWGPGDLNKALDWWAVELLEAFEACAKAPADRVLTVQLEMLIADAREAEYTRLLAFAGLADDPAMRGFFENSATPERSHRGRWRTDVPADVLPGFAARYRATVDKLLAAGWPYRPDDAAPIPTTTPAAADPVPAPPAESPAPAAPPAP